MARPMSVTMSSATEAARVAARERANASDSRSLSFVSRQANWVSPERARTNATTTKANARMNAKESTEWETLARRGVEVNPCNSRTHPAAIAGVAPFDASRPKRSLQEAYDPRCIDFTCGLAHASEAKIGLKTYRCDDEENALRSEFSFPATFEEFPGIIGPAMYGVVASSAGNWAASIALMDRAILPRPPLVAMKSLSLEVRDRVGPNEPLEIKSRILSIDDFAEPFTVVVELRINSQPTGTTVAKAVCCFEKIGAVRSMR